MARESGYGSMQTTHRHVVADLAAVLRKAGYYQVDKEVAEAGAAGHGQGGGSGLRMDLMYTDADGARHAIDFTAFGVERYGAQHLTQAAARRRSQKRNKYEQWLNEKMGVPPANFHVVCMDTLGRLDEDSVTFLRHVCATAPLPHEVVPAHLFASLSARALRATATALRLTRSIPLGSAPALPLVHCTRIVR